MELIQFRYQLNTDVLDVHEAVQFIFIPNLNKNFSSFGFVKAAFIHCRAGFGNSTSSCWKIKGLHQDECILPYHLPFKALTHRFSIQKARSFKTH